MKIDFYIEATFKALLVLVTSANSIMANLFSWAYLFGHLGPLLILISITIPQFYLSSKKLFNSNLEAKTGWTKIVLSSLSS